MALLYAQEGVHQLAVQTAGGRLPAAKEFDFRGGKVHGLFQAGVPDDLQMWPAHPKGLCAQQVRADKVPALQFFVQDGAVPLPGAELHGPLLQQRQSAKMLQVQARVQELPLQRLLDRRP